MRRFAIEVIRAESVAVAIDVESLCNCRMLLYLLLKSEIFAGRNVLPLFEKLLKPAGIAMLTVDMPGIGFSNHLKLEQDTSRLHQAVLKYMAKVPWVDQSRVALMGMRMGGNALTRLAYVEPKLVRAGVSVGAVRLT